MEGVLMKTLAIALVAATFGVSAASSASAKPGLTAYEASKVIAVGTGELAFDFTFELPTTHETCGWTTYGILLSNGKPGVPFDFETPWIEVPGERLVISCTTEGDKSGTASLTVGLTKLTVDGAVAKTPDEWKISFTPKMPITLPGPCIYEVSKIVLPWSGSGQAALYSRVDFTGKLDRKAGSLACASTLSAVTRIVEVGWDYGSFAIQFATTS
jgi:hypothetical protein